jgi:hypothetical protein
VRVHALERVDYARKARLHVSRSTRLGWNTAGHAMPVSDVLLDKRRDNTQNKTTGKDPNISRRLKDPKCGQAQAAELREDR